MSENPRPSKLARLREGLSSNRWLVALGVLWTIEIWWVQRLTTSPTLWHDPVAVVKDQVFRVILDAGIVAIALLTLPRVVLWALFGAGVLFSGVVISYHMNYERALSIFVILEQWNEGMAVAGGGALLIVGSLSVLGLSALFKSALAYRAGPGAGGAPKAGVALFCVWLVFLGILHLDHKDMARLRTFEQAGGIAHVYGYIPTWAAELYFVNQQDVLDDALRQMEIRSDQITPVESPMPFAGNVVLLQVESLDAAVIEFELDGREVTPRLNALRDTSFYFVSQAPKQTGSCDADFTALMGRMPSTRIVSYRISDLPFETSVVGAFNDAGYRTGFFHGVSGTFFHRRDAFEEMGFDVLRFREEYIGERDADPELWTVDDGAMFDWATEWLNSSDEPSFMMVITATSHLPFNFETPGMEPSFYPGTTSPQLAYFDAVHYVDAEIGEFVDNLPAGTTLILYGDHFSRMEEPELGYEHTMIDGFGLVPVMVHVVGEDVSNMQQTRDSVMVEDGTLTLLDVFTWTWSSLEPTLDWSPYDQTTEGAIEGAAEGPATAPASEPPNDGP
jgi:phosphoglycerol transferase MdoB-like AlkP superfamily enzyme